jgi:hypothetical protein
MHTDICYMNGRGNTIDIPDTTTPPAFWGTGRKTVYSNMLGLDGMTIFRIILEKIACASVG